jgi:hypothetical protein
LIGKRLGGILESIDCDHFLMMNLSHALTQQVNSDGTMVIELDFEGAKKTYTFSHITAVNHLETMVSMQLPVCEINNSTQEIKINLPNPALLGCDNSAINMLIRHLFSPLLLPSAFGNFYIDILDINIWLKEGKSFIFTWASHESIEVAKKLAYERAVTMAGSEKRITCLYPVEFRSLKLQSFRKLQDLFNQWRELPLFVVGVHALEYTDVEFVTLLAQYDTQPA